jgi:hypothetical protein
MEGSPYHSVFWNQGLRWVIIYLAQYRMETLRIRDESAASQLVSLSFFIAACFFRKIRMRHIARFYNEMIAGWRTLLITQTETGGCPSIRAKALSRTKIS